MMFPHVVGNDQAGGCVESSGWRTRIRLVADMPFSKRRGFITMPLEDLAHGREFRIKPSLARLMRSEHLPFARDNNPSANPRVTQNKSLGEQRSCYSGTPPPPNAPHAGFHRADHQTDESRPTLNRQKTITIFGRSTACTARRTRCPRVDDIDPCLICSSSSSWGSTSARGSQSTETGLDNMLANTRSATRPFRSCSRIRRVETRMSPLPCGMTAMSEPHQALRMAQ